MCANKVMKHSAKSSYHIIVDFVWSSTAGMQRNHLLMYCCLSDFQTSNPPDRGYYNSARGFTTIRLPKCSKTWESGGARTFDDPNIHVLNIIQLGTNFQADLTGSAFWTTIPMVWSDLSCASRHVLSTQTPKHPNPVTPDLIRSFPCWENPDAEI